MIPPTALQIGGTLEVEVTAAHVAEGEQGDCRRCPVALALQAATGDPAARLEGFLAVACDRLLRMDLASLHAVRRYDLTGDLVPRLVTFSVSAADVEATLPFSSAVSRPT